MYSSSLSLIHSLAHLAVLFFYLILLLLMLPTQNGWWLYDELTSCCKYFSNERFSCRVHANESTHSTNVAIILKCPLNERERKKICRAKQSSSFFLSLTRSLSLSPTLLHDGALITKKEYKWGLLKWESERDRESGNAMYFHQVSHKYSHKQAHIYTHTHKNSIFLQGNLFP